MNKIVKAMSITASETYSSVCAPVQNAAVVAYDQGTQIQHYLNNCRKVLEIVGNTISDKLNAINITHHNLKVAFI